MPKLAQILANERVITMDMGEGEKLTITYRPGVVTPETHDAIMDRVDGGRQPAAIAQSLSVSLVQWDLLDDKGKPYPVDEKSLRVLPTRFLGDVFSAIQEDLSPNEKKSEESAGSF